MRYAKLGNTDLTVSRVCLGCMGFGDAARGQHSWTLDEEHSREIIKRAQESWRRTNRQTQTKDTSGRRAIRR